jgi:leucyl/phenylalanyl-tRNA---protein transferase
MHVERPRIVPPPSQFLLPDPALAEPGNDVIAIGADLEPGTLLTAYATGLFPMPVDPGRRRSKIAWYSPDPRGIIPIDGLHVSRSLRRAIPKFDIRIDTRFADVVLACGDPHREGRWITQAIVDAYTTLHQLGWAHSVEVFRDDELVGGLYGVRIRGLFAGESMFHHLTDASKVALVGCIDWLRATDATLFDVQWTTPHLRSLGAVDVSRTDYLRSLAEAIAAR